MFFKSSRYEFYCLPLTNYSFDHSGSLYESANFLKKKEKKKVSGVSDLVFKIFK